MVKIRYLGLADPERDFLEMRPYRDRLIQMGQKYKPTSVEYHLLQDAHVALDRACTHFTGDERFYWTGDSGGVGAKPK